jgi:hypothetical protein
MVGSSQGDVAGFSVRRTNARFQPPVHSGRGYVSGPEHRHEHHYVLGVRCDLWRPLPFAKPDQLVSISGRHPETGRRAALSLDDVRGLAASTQSLTDIAPTPGEP